MFREHKHCVYFCIEIFLKYFKICSNYINVFQLNTSIDVFLSIGEEITAGNQTLHWMSLSHT